MSLRPTSERVNRQPASETGASPAEQHYAPRGTQARRSAVLPQREPSAWLRRVIFAGLAGSISMEERPPPAAPANRSRPFPQGSGPGEIRLQSAGTFQVFPLEDRETARS